MAVVLVAALGAGCGIEELFAVDPQPDLTFRLRDFSVVDTAVPADLIKPPDLWQCAPGAMGNADCTRLGLGLCCGGACVNLASDVNNCGACGVKCPAVLFGTLVCNMGVCVVGSCQTGHADCDRMPLNGCEVSTASDPKNCNLCGRVCPTPPNAVAICLNRTCTGACNTGFADCNANLGLDGCEVTLASDDLNCGVCRRVCPQGMHCKSGGCQ